jgi:dsRNA-specific ribonuclease
MSKLPNLPSLTSLPNLPPSSPAKSGLPSLPSISSLPSLPALSSLPPVATSPAKVSKITIAAPFKPLSLPVSSVPTSLQVECANPPPPFADVETKPLKDPRQHLETFFGTRNGIVGNPIEGVNYTLETLYYMTSHNRANQITDLIINKMKELGHNHQTKSADRSQGDYKIPFAVYECCAGMGGNTMSFLDNPNISYVVSYECLPERREMFKRNIAMYELNKNGRSIAPDTPFVDPPCSNIPIVRYFDPPWMSESIKGQHGTKNDYILSGMKVGEKTLEEWIVSCPHCPLTVIRVPPGYKLKATPGFTVESLLIKNSLLLMSYPDTLKSGGSISSHPAALKTTPSNLSLSACKRPLLLQKKAQEVAEEKVWKQGLKEYLRNTVLPLAISNESALDKLVSDEAMDVWVKAFTHESFNPNQNYNYEELELYGDLVMGVNFIKFLRQSYPEITRSQLSEFRTIYLAKNFQAGISLKLGMGAYVRTRYKKSMHVYEDILESLFGALDLIGDLVFKFGAGGGLAFNLIVALYKDVELDWNITKGNPKTQVKQIFERLGLVSPKKQERIPEDSVEDESGKITFTISFPLSSLDLLRSYGIKVTSPIVARYTDVSKKRASDNAYILAVSNLAKMGITEEWVNEIRGRKDLDNPELIPYINSAMERLREEGFDRFYFEEHHVKGKIGGLTTSKYVQMIGVNKEGRKEILTMTDPIDNVLEGKKQLLSSYASYDV